MNNNAPEKAVIERPEAQGLFDPAFERDACGVGFIADLAGKKSHKIVADALGMLCNLEHRGAVGADPLAGDGAESSFKFPTRSSRRNAPSSGSRCRSPAATLSANSSCRRTSG